MKRLAKWAVRYAAEKIDAYDAGSYPPLVRFGNLTYVRVPERAAREAPRPEGNPFMDQSGIAYRSETAMRLMDDDVYGFLVLMFEPGQKEITLRMQTDPAWMPLFHSALAKVLQAA